MSTQETELSELWSFQDSTTGRDIINSAAIGPDGTSVFSGVVGGDWKYNASSLTSGRSVAAKLDIDGTILWKWQDDTLRFGVRAAAVDQDGSIVIAGSWMVSQYSFYFAVRKLDSSGNFVWEYQDEQSETDIDMVRGLAIGDDGSIYCAGFRGEIGFFSNDVDDSAFSAFKLDKDGTLLWKEQEEVGYGLDQLIDVALGDDGSVAFAGYTSSNYYVVLREQETGIEMWALEGEASGVNNARAVARGEDGSILVAGERDVGSYYTEEPGFYVVKLDSNGTEMWSFQDNGTTANDDGGIYSQPPAATLSGVAVLADGSIFCAGRTNGDWDGPNAGGEGTFDVAAFILSSNGQDILWKYQDGSVGTDGALTVAAAPDGETILIAGYTGYNETVVGSEDLIAVMFSTDPSATVPTPSPALASAPQTPAPVAAVAPLTPTLAPTPATAVLPIFDVPEEMSPAFAGMGVSTISMALLVLGCCCWGGRMKKM